MNENCSEIKTDNLKNMTTSEIDKKKSTDSQNSIASLDEDYQLGLSPYSSDSDDVERDKVRSIKEKVERSASDDSAVGLEEDIINISKHKSRRQTLTVTDIPLRAALLPLAEPTQLPESPTQDLANIFNNLNSQTAIPSKVLLDERVIEVPDDRIASNLTSRIESENICVNDNNCSEIISGGGVRIVRTPSVVVSDYSDDIMCGITLEEIEYFRAHRLNRQRTSADTTESDKDEEIFKSSDYDSTEDKFGEADFSTNKHWGVVEKHIDESV